MPIRTLAPVNGCTTPMGMSASAAPGETAAIAANFNQNVHRGPAALAIPRGASYDWQHNILLVQRKPEP